MALLKLNFSTGQWKNNRDYATIFNECLERQIRKESLFRLKADEQGK